MECSGVVQSEFYDFSEEFNLCNIGISTFRTLYFFVIKICNGKILSYTRNTSIGEKIDIGSDMKV